MLHISGNSRNGKEISVLKWYQVQSSRL